MTATVDDQRQFIDVDISHPGATSDYLAFLVSSFNRKLVSGLLLPLVPSASYNLGLIAHNCIKLRIIPQLIQK